jgi:uncharacterized iron-regulated membrane protein
MTNLFLFDVRVDPVSSLPWGGLIVLLVIVFVLAVSLVISLVLLLLWWKRKQLRAQQAQAEANPARP